MDLEFFKLLMDNTKFPEEAKTETLRCAQLVIEKGQEEALDGAVEFYYDHDLDMKLVTPLVESIGEESGIHLYMAWQLFLLQTSKPAVEAYREKGVPEAIIWDTFSDLRYKTLECKNVYGTWGIFVSFWYPIFFSCDLVKLGRLEYENILYHGETYEKNGYVLKDGDPVKNIHIPSSGEPFDKASRLASYKKAYEFFKEERNGGPLVCVCHSWLLYPENRKILPPTSNIVSFMGDFDLQRGEIEEEFHDAWRVFGSDAQKPAEQLPEKTSMQRAFKQWLVEGNKTGEGFGILIFDGESIVNQ